MRPIVAALLAVVVSCCALAAPASAEEGYWERLAQELPRGSQRRSGVDTSWRTYTVRGERLDGVQSWATYNGEQHVVRWTTTWSLPPKRLQAGAAIQIRCSISARQVQGRQPTSFTHAAWIEGEQATRKSTEVKLRMETARTWSAAKVLRLRAPSGPGRTGRFALVLNGGWAGFAGVDLPTVYPYRWVVARPEPKRVPVVVRAELEDEDDQLTPADRARLRVSFVNESSDTDLENARLELWFEKKAAQLGGEEPKLTTWLEHTRVTDAVRFDRPNMGTRIDRKGFSLAAGGRKEMNVDFHVEDEDNYWIYRALFQGGKRGALDNRRKPRKEIGYPLQGALRVRIRTDKATLFDSAIDVMRGKEIARVQYPDLRVVAGWPSDQENHDYYRFGDPGYSQCGGPEARAVAVRAARYGAPHGLMPEGTPLSVIDNVARYVHESYMPKVWPETIANLSEVSREMYRYDYAPGHGRYTTKEGLKKGFPCIEHAYTYNGLCRALGFAARAVNALTWVSVPGYGGSFQDASSQIYCQGRWHYRSLFGTAVQTHPRDRYGGALTSFEVWIAQGRYEGKFTRFEMGGPAMAKSPYWRFWGYGNRKGFYAAKERPIGHHLFGLAAIVMYKLHSPVAASVKRADGTIVGARGAVEITDEVRRFFTLGGTPPAGLPAPSEAGVFIPEGLPIYTEGPDGFLRVTKATQMLVVPANGPADKLTDQLVLRGTGDGPWRLGVQHISEKGIVTYPDQRGTAKRGATQTIDLARLQPTGPAEPFPDRRPTPPAPPQPRPYLGIASATADGFTAEVHPVEEGGVFIYRVAENSPAAKAGLRALDVVRRVGSSPVTKPGDVSVAVRAAGVGATVEVEVLRGGKPHVLRATLGDRNAVPRDETGVQRYVLFETAEEAKAKLPAWLTEGFRIIDVGASPRGWMVTLTKLWNPVMQACFVGPSYDDLWPVIQRAVKDAYLVSSLSFAPDGTAMVVLSKMSAWTGQRFLRKRKLADFKDGIRRAWKDGYKITELVHSGTQWFAVATQGTKVEGQSFHAYGSWETFAETIRATWRAGRLLTRVIQHDGTWFAVSSRAGLGADQAVDFARDYASLREPIGDRWARGYSIQLLRWDGNRWCYCMRRDPRR